jgi:hypothetical protein
MYLDFISYVQLVYKTVEYWGTEICSQYTCPLFTLVFMKGYISMTLINFQLFLCHSASGAMLAYKYFIKKVCFELTVAL